MGDRGKRIPLARAIYQDRYGITVRVAGKDIGRWPVGTPLAELRQAQRDYRDEQSLPETDARRGTLAEWFEAYLLTCRAGAHRRDERALLEHWRRAGFDRKAPGGVTPLDVRQQLAAFGAETKTIETPAGGQRRVPRFAPRTINHLRRVLGAVYRATNGNAGYNPVRDVGKLTVIDEEARDIPYALIEFIFAQIPDRGRANKGEKRPTINTAKIRLQVEAYTARPPAEIKRIQPRDLFLDDRAMLARPRRKGAGAQGKRLPLTDRGVAALRAFARHNLFGPYNTRSAAKVWTGAVQKARALWEAEQAKLRHPAPWPLPDNVRPYDLRHSFATDLLRATDGNLKAVKDMLLHTTFRTTERYTLGMVDEQARTSVQALSAFWEGATRVPQAHGKRRQNAQKPPSGGRLSRTRPRRGKAAKPSDFSRK